MMGDTVALKKADGKIDRTYKVNPKFRQGIVNDMKFRNHEPDEQTKVSFPWLKEYFD